MPHRTGHNLRHCDAATLQHPRLSIRSSSSSSDDPWSLSGTAGTARLAPGSRAGPSREPQASKRQSCPARPACSARSRSHGRDTAVQARHQAQRGARRLPACQEGQLPRRHLPPQRCGACTGCTAVPSGQQRIATVPGRPLNNAHTPQRPEHIYSQLVFSPPSLIPYTTSKSLWPLALFTRNSPSSAPLRFNHHNNPHTLYNNEVHRCHRLRCS